MISSTSAACGIGLDFGTTNSALAFTLPDGTTRLARFSLHGTPTSTFRSILYFEPTHLDRRRKPIPWCGPQAIEQYLDSDGSGRLIQSLKTWLGSPSFRATQVFGTIYTLEELITFILKELRAAADRDFPDALTSRAVVGRPVNFSHSDGGDNTYAQTRLLESLKLAGFTDVVFEFEPVAAALHYEQRLTKDERVLIADFGGGTSDFCVIEVGPTAGKRPSGERILGTDGVAIAGDSFDSRILRRAVAPWLGHGSSYRPLFGNDLQTMPAWPYARLRRWHQLSFLKSRETLEQLKALRARSLEPNKLDALLHIIDHDLGYYLYQAVEKTKIELSTQTESVFRFHEPPVNIEVKVTRAEFEDWISPELTQIGECVDRLLAKVDLRSDQIDRVFMTGGSSLVPAVRAVFAGRFGEERLAAGEELTSVASGLARRASEASRLAA